MGPTAAVSAAPGSVAPAPVAAPEPVVIPPNALNKEACLKALADLRHAKWFQVCLFEEGKYKPEILDLKEIWISQEGMKSRQEKIANKGRRCKRYHVLSFLMKCLPVIFK